MHKGGLSSRKIRELLNVSANTVQKIVKRYRERLTVVNNP